MTKINSLIHRCLITGLITIVCLIFIKKDNNFKTYFTNNIMGDNFNFAYLNKIYAKYISGSIPFKKFFDNNIEPVFSEKLEYSSKSSYLDGVSLDVLDDYLVPALNSGIVVFVGEKEGYGNVVIIEDSTGVDVWYGNLSIIGVNLYDYIVSGSLIGNSNSNLYLVFKKDGKILDYENYI